MSSRREQQEEILKSSQRQLNDIKKLRTELVDTMRLQEHSKAIMEAMITKSVDMKKKIEEVTKANLDYERQMYEDN